MAIEKNYYTIDPQGKLSCVKCGVPLIKGKAKFMYLDNGFPVELPVCPVDPPGLKAQGAQQGHRLSGAGAQIQHRRAGGQLRQLYHAAGVLFAAGMASHLSSRARSTEATFPRASSSGT